MLRINNFSFFQNLCLLILRLFIGGILTFAWLEKIVNQSTSNWAQVLEIEPYIQVTWVSIEVLAAVSLLFGVLTFFGAFLSLSLMVVSFLWRFLLSVTHNMVYDSSLLLICSLIVISFAVLIFGPGVFSLDRLIFGKKK